MCIKTIYLSWQTKREETALEIYMEYPDEISYSWHIYLKCLLNLKSIFSVFLKSYFYESKLRIMLNGL